MNLLKKIISYKKKEVEVQKRALPLEELKHKDYFCTRDFKGALNQAGISLIAEIKPRSPSAGVIKESFDPLKIAKLYEDSGVRAVSVLTEKKFFGGSLDNLTMVRNALHVPLLRKDFIIDEYQIYESRAAGADAILLIARLLSCKEIERFLSVAKEVGLMCLVEIHSPDELERVQQTSAEIIGINNRNLDTLHIDIEVSLSLIDLVPKDYIIVSASGVKTRADILKLEKAGFNAVLIGEAILKSENIGDKIREFTGRKGEGT